MTNPTLDPISKLAVLAAHRNTRTDRLHVAVVQTLLRLEPHVEPGTTVTVDGCTLGYSEVRSNVGTARVWSFESDGGESCSDMALDVGAERYLHGDFNHLLSGPTRDILIDFAVRAAEFVAQLTAGAEADVAALDSAIRAIP